MYSSTKHGHNNRENGMKVPFLGHFEDNLNQFDEERYDPYRIPPNINMAVLHGRSKRVGFRHVQESNSPGRSCPCCGLLTNYVPIPLSTHRDNLAFLGIGYSLYFHTIIGFVFFLIIAFIGIGLPSLYFVYDGFKYRHKDFTVWELLQALCFGWYYRESSSLSQEYTKTLNLGSLVLIEIFVVCFIYIIRAKVGNLKRTLIQPSDYTIMVSQLPSTTTEEMLHRFFSQFPLADGGNPTVRKISMTYKIETYVKLYNQRKKVMAEKQNLLNELQVRYSSDGPLVQEHQEEMASEVALLDQEIKSLSDQIRCFENECNSSLASKFTGIAFISFDQKSQARAVEDAFHRSVLVRLLFSVLNILTFGFFYEFPCFNKYRFQGELISVTRAPEPTDVEWMNLGEITTPHRVRRLLKGTLGLAVLLAFNYFVFQIMDYELTKRDLSEYWTGWSCSLLISCINGFASLFVDIFASFEKYSTYTQENASKVTKMLLYTIMYSIVTPTLLFYRRIAHAGSKETKVAVGERFTLNILLFLIMSTTLQFFLNIIGGDLIKKLYFRRKILREGNHSVCTQAEANSYFEGTEFQIADKFVIVLTLFLVSLLFAGLCPLGLIITVGSLSFLFWQDKVLLLRFHALPRSVSESIMKAVIHVALLCPLLFIVYNAVLSGHLKYDDISDITTSVFGWMDASAGVTVLIFLYYTFWIMDVKNLHSPKSDPNVLSYDTARPFFLTEYDRENPMTVLQGYRDLLEYLEKKKAEEAQSVQAVDEIELQEKRNEIVEHELLPIQRELSEFTNRNISDLRFQVLDSFAEKTYCHRNYGLENLSIIDRNPSHSVVLSANTLGQEDNTVMQRKYSVANHDSILAEITKVYLPKSTTSPSRQRLESHSNT